MLVPPSAPTKVLGRQIVSTFRAVDMYRDAVVVLVETGQRVTPTNVGVVFGGPLGKHLNEPALLDGNHEQLGAGHQREVQREAREHRARSGCGGSAVPVSTPYRPR